MRNKWMVVMILVVMWALPATADNWGAGIRLGFAENSPKTMQDDYDEAFLYGFSSKELSKGNGLFGLEALYEWNLSNEAEKIGLKIGIEGYGENEIKLHNSAWLGIAEYKGTESTAAYPFTVYYKRDNGIKKWSWFVGGGVTIIHTELEEKIDFAEYKTNKSKIFPHLMAGTEYRFTKLFALGLEARYNISAKLKDEGEVISDRSGFGAMLTGRFYF